jgi:hypothetical protein
VTAVQELFIIDAYINEEAFELYVGKVSLQASVRMLSNQMGEGTTALAKAYAKTSQLQIRASMRVRDRAIFLDQRGWILGEAIKNAAGRKPTYMIELGEPVLSAVRDIYNKMWTAAAVVLPEPSRNHAIAGQVASSQFQAGLVRQHSGELLEFQVPGAGTGPFLGTTRLGSTIRIWSQAGSHTRMAP